MEIEGTRDNRQPGAHTQNCPYLSYLVLNEQPQIPLVSTGDPDESKRRYQVIPYSLARSCNPSSATRSMAYPGRQGFDMEHGFQK